MLARLPGVFEGGIRSELTAKFAGQFYADAMSCGRADPRH